MSDSSAGGPAVPAIRTFQFDDSTVGDLPSSVNLFRGDVNLTQTLLSLPGPAADSGLDVDLSIQYQSNVTRSALTHNVEAPTGILGLGWTLPLTFIEAVDGGSPVASTRSYLLHQNGGSSQLVRMAEAPFLVTLDAALADGLQDGAPVPAGIVEAFAGVGLLLSASATVRGSGPWTLEDDDNLQTFRLELADGGLQAYDGGEAYQAESYQFQTIVYYPEYERWVVTSTDAVRRSFGGSSDPAAVARARASRSQSIAWSVFWADAAGRPAWRGSTTRTDSQIQVARAWYLESVQDRWGNRVRYAYDTTDVEAGAVGGLPFTRATYLRQVSDVFGRSASLVYADKLWSDADDAPREYADPHRAVPDDRPAAFQDAYETRYLQRVEVADAEGEPLFDVVMTYDPRPTEPAPANQVANVTNTTGRLRGDTFKRFLTGLELVERDGRILPGMVFDYALDPVDPASVYEETTVSEEAVAEEGAETDSSPGALRSILFPQGALATYAYTEQDLAICQRGQTAPRPAAIPEGATPRVFFGGDYVAVCYYSQSAERLSLEIYTWAGSWLRWSLTDDAVLDSEGLDLSTLDVLADRDFLALHYERNDPAERVVYVFERDVTRTGQWRPATIDGVTTAPDTPSLVFSRQGQDVTFGGGATYFVVTQMDPSSLSGQLDRLTYRWTTRAWTRETLEVARYSYLAASASSYALLDVDGRVSLFALDGVLAWSEGGTATLEGLSTTNLDSVRVVAGVSTLAVANLRSENQQQIEYALWALQWDADYQLSQQSLGRFTDFFGQGNPRLGWTPQVIADSLIASNGNLARFDGARWQVNTSLNPGIPSSGVAQRYAFGPDYAIRVLAPTTGVGRTEAVVLAYDPERDSDVWDARPIAIAQDLPAQTASFVNWPRGGESDSAVIGPYVYFRGTSNDWGEVVARTAGADLDALVGADRELDSESLIDEASQFLAYSVLEDGGGRGVQALILRNGRADAAPVSFEGQQMVSPAEQGLVGPGVSPQGPSVFVTFPQGVSFDSTPTLDLNRSTDQAVDGPIRHFTVTGLSITDGFGDPIPTSYRPDASTAGCDPSGSVVKFFESTIYPGTDDPSRPAYGRTTTRYLNGLDLQGGDNLDNLLDGMLLDESTYDADGRLLEKTTNTYRVYDQISVPAPGGVAARALRGGWATQVAQESLKDGVSRTVTTDFVLGGMAGPWNGRPAASSTVSHGGDGQPETFSRSFTYGAQFVDGLQAIYALGDDGQRISQRQADGGAAAPFQSTAVTYAPFESLDGTTPWASEASFGWLDAASVAFPYADYSPGDRPAGWIPASRVVHRTARGQERETLDPLGTPSATLFDRDGELAVARSSNVDLDGFAFLAFQAYEDTARWRLDGVTYDSDDARTGVRSACLGRGATAATTVAPRASTTWLVGCWYKTPAGYDPGASSGFRVTVTAGGTAQPELFTPFEDTGDAWRYVSIPVPTPAGEALTLELEIANQVDAAVLLDSVAVLPLENSLTARTFDPASRQPTSTVDGGGRTSQIHYNRAFQKTLSTGAAGQVRELDQRFFSRSGQPDSLFSAASPNATLTLTPADGGEVETFRDGGAWSTRWRPEDPSRWTASDGALRHSGAGSDALTRVDDDSSIGTSQAATRALYVEVEHDGDEAPDLSMQVGDVRVGLRGGAWFADQAGTSWTPLATPPPARQWLLIAGDGVVLFYGDGQLLFSRRTRPAGSTIALEVAGEQSLRQLTLMRNVRLSVSFEDAAGRDRQVQSLAGATSLIAMTVNDPLSRELAVTRAAPGDFGAGADLPVMAYSAPFLDVAGFLANLDTTWRMSGLVADYYGGQTEDGATRADDEGYPYRGRRYEASPRDQVVELSRPGREHAIDLEVPEDQRKTTRLAYGANDGGGGLPAGQYAQVTQTNPTQTRAVTLDDQLEQQVATRYVGADGDLLSSTEGLRFFTPEGTPSLASLQTRLPNATTEGPQSEPDRYVEDTTTDALQRMQSLEDPDSRTSQFVFDDAGRMRFVEPALDAGQAWYLYYRYDALGRVIESGTVEGTFDRAALAVQANEPSYPSNGVATTRTTYDGDGSQPQRIGKKVETTTWNPDPDAGAGDDVTVVETFDYDAAGHIRSVSARLEGGADAEATVGYSYNVLGEILRVDYPEPAPFDSVHYRLDGLGRITGIGESEGGDELAAYTYSADGQIETESLAGGAWRVVTTLTPAVEVRSIVATDRSGSRSLALTYAYEADGLVGSRQVADTLGDGAEYDQTYAYDGQRRWQSAEGWRPESIDQYDPNGNIWDATLEGVTQISTMEPGSDRLATVLEETGTETGTPSEVVYSARGLLTQGLGRTLTYDRASNLTTSIVTDAASLRLAYGGGRQRVLKRVAGGTETVYWNGAGMRPICLRRDGVWSALVQGPNGILCLRDETTRYPLKDSVGSTWAVVDADGPLAAYQYTPFGVLSGGDPSVFPFLFQSSEWDAEVGLYNFSARLYDPRLRRFLAPDPARQFASLYLFDGNTPLNAVDPSGEISVWAQVGIGAALVAITAAGIALTVFTGGASDAAAASADAALLGAEGAALGTEAALGAGEAAAVGGEAALGAGEAAAVGGEAGVVGAEAGGSVVAAGATAGEATTASSALTTVGINVASGALTGGGISGLQYDVTHHQDFTAKGFFEAVGIGAAAGAAGGLVSGAGGLVADSLTSGLGTGAAGIAGRIGAKVVVSAASSVVSSDVSQVLTNVAAHQPWYQGLLESTLQGAAKGAAIGAVTGAWAEKVNVAKAAGVSDARIDRISTGVDALLTKAKSNDAIMIYTTAGFFVVSGYAVWGAYELSS